MYFSTLLEALHVIVGESRGLTEAEAEAAMALILTGASTPVQIAAFLVALRGRGETVEELTGFARAMRAAATPIEIPRPLLDTCGTGGNPFAAFNVSTTAAFVLAGAGVRVAKHGNRAISSRCGSADVLERLGVDTSRPADSIARHGIGFLFAPAFHPAMRHVQPVRVELKLRTVFNMLGPLTNPARANTQIVGAFSEHAASLMAHALAALGLERGFVFHGADGMGEVSTTGATSVFAIEGGAVRALVFQPEDFGVERARPQDLAGGNAEENAKITRAVLSGARGGAWGAARDIVLVNAAVGLMATERAGSIGEAMGIAAESIDSGAAQGKLAAMSSGNF
jgi:anthranilate phosphoribosyltransferase